MLNTIEKLGLYSRTLDFMVNDSGNLSGREIIWNTLLREIFENPFRLRGINAEWHTFGTYAHNIFIELCYQLGVLIGFVLSGVIVFVALSNLLVKNLGRLELLKLIFLFASLPTLLVSRSLWTEYSFWIWVGLNISTISFSRHLKNNRR